MLKALVFHFAGTDCNDQVVIIGKFTVFTDDTVLFGVYLRNPVDHQIKPVSLFQFFQRYTDIREL